jgi:hypothetical protein
MDEKPVRRVRGPAWDRRLIERAKERRRLGDSIKEISRALLPEEIPESTIKSWVADVRQDPSGEWRLWDVLPAPDPAVALPVLATVVWSTGGRVTGLTNDQARWVTLLAQVRPDLIGENAYQLARAFIEARAADDDNELRRLQLALAEGAARLKWPGRQEGIAQLREAGRRVKADLRAGRDPFLDGKEYQP